MARFALLNCTIFWRDLIYTPALRFELPNALTKSLNLKNNKQKTFIQHTKSIHSTILPFQLPKRKRNRSLLSRLFSSTNSADETIQFIYLFKRTTADGSPQNGWRPQKISKKINQFNSQRYSVRKNKSSVQFSSFRFISLFVPVLIQFIFFGDIFHLIATIFVSFWTCFFSFFRLARTTVFVSF